MHNFWVLFKCPYSVDMIKNQTRTIESTLKLMMMPNGYYSYIILQFDRFVCQMDYTASIRGMHPMPAVLSKVVYEFFILLANEF